MGLPLPHCRSGIYPPVGPGQQADPVGDIACAWELLAEEWRETGELPPAPELLPDGPQELHLDHPLLHTDR